MTFSNKLTNVKKFYLKNHISNEEDKSQDGASKFSFTKRRIQLKRAKLKNLTKNRILDFSKKIDAKVEEK